MQRPPIRIASEECTSTGQRRVGSVERPSSAEDAVARSKAGRHEFHENGPASGTSQTHHGRRYQRGMRAVQPKQQVGIACRRSEKCTHHPLGSRRNCQQICELLSPNGSDSSDSRGNSCGYAACKSSHGKACHPRGKTIQSLRKAGKSASAPSTCSYRPTEVASQTALLSTSLPLEESGTLGANQRAAPSPTPLCDPAAMQKEQLDAMRPSWMRIGSSACSVGDMSSGCCDSPNAGVCQSMTSCGARSRTEVSSFDVWSFESDRKTFEGKNAKLAGLQNSRQVSPTLSASIQTEENLKRQSTDKISSPLENTARQNGGSKRTENVSILASISVSLTEEQPFSHLKYIRDLLESTDAHDRSGDRIVATLECGDRDPTSPVDESLSAELGLKERVAAWDPSQEDNYALSAPGQLELYDFDISDPRRPPSPVKQEDAPRPTAKTCIPTSRNVQRATNATPAACTDLCLYEDLEWFTEASASRAPPRIVSRPSASGAVTDLMSGRRSSADDEARRHLDAAAKQSRTALPVRQPSLHCALGIIEATEVSSAGSLTSHSHVADGGGKRVARPGTVQDFPLVRTQAELPSRTPTPDGYNPADSSQSELGDASVLPSTCTTNGQLLVTGVEKNAAENGGVKGFGGSVATNGTGMHRRRGDTNGHGKKTKDEKEKLALVTETSDAAQDSTSDRTATEPEAAIGFAMGR